MIFKPSMTHELWDVWLYYFESVHYLFFLRKSRPGCPWDGVSVATSTDGVHFEEIGTIIQKRSDAEWLGTGSTWRAGDRFMMNFSETKNGTNRIFFAESDDLLHWRRLPDELSIGPDANIYDAGVSGRWDCIWTLQEDDGSFRGYLTARPCPINNGVIYESIGSVVSEDGVHWEAAKPVQLEWGEWPRMSIFEVGAVEKIGPKYYALLGFSEDSLGNRQMLGRMGARVGMYAFSSDSSTGPFQPIKLGYRVLTSNEWMTYFARFYRCGDEMLVAHHSIGNFAESDIWFAPLKKAAIDNTGGFFLHYWPGNERLKGKELPLDMSAAERIFPPETSGSWNVSASSVQIDEAYTGGVLVLAQPFDFNRGIFLEGEISIEEPPKRWSGVGFVVEHETEAGFRGTAIIAQTRGKTEIGVFTKRARSLTGIYGDGNSFNPDDVLDIGIAPGTPTHFRLLLRGVLLEFYLGELLVQCYSLREKPTGRFGLVAECGKASFRDLRAWEII